jgi:2-dehydro-3-deoxyglucarate aldolase
LRTLKNKIQAKEPTIGSWISFSYPPVCEMMVKAGFEWLVIDMEHTGIDFADARLLIQLIDLAGCTPLVRVGANDALLIKRVMDAGAHGVVVPMVNSVEDAQKAVAAAYYPPLGKRGVGLYRAQGYGTGFDAYKQWAARETIVIVQIEHIDGVRSLDAILQTKGVDGFIVGPYDLSASLGFSGEFAHPEVCDALQIVEKVMKHSSKAAGYHVVHSDRELLQAKIHQGFSFIAYGDDMVFLAEKLRQETQYIKGIFKR